MTRYHECALCGAEGPQVRIALVQWVDPEPERFSAIPRCSAIEECRGRVESQGEDWPVIDAKRDVA